MVSINTSSTSSDEPGQQEYRSAWLGDQKRPTLVLVSGLTLIFMLMALVLVIGLSRMSSIEHQLGAVVTEHNEQGRLASAMMFAARERSILLQKMVITTDPFARDDYYMKMRELGSQFITARQQLVAQALNLEEKALLDQQKQLTSRVGALQFDIVQLTNDDNLDAAKTLLYEQALPLQVGVTNALQEFVDLQLHDNTLLLDSAHGAFNMALTSMGTLAGGAVVVIVLVAVIMIRRITAVTRSLEKSETQERAIRDNMNDSVITINEKGIIDSCNPAVEGMFGYQSDELLGQNVSILMPENQRSDHNNHVGRFFSSNRVNVIGMNRDLEGQRKDGSVFPLEISITTILVDGQRKVVGILRDITHRVEVERAMERSREELERLVAQRTTELTDANARLQHMASHDTLTNLPNRFLMQEQLKLITAQSSRNGQLTALLFLDLDGFKDVNDNLGHEAGDTVLVETARRLHGCVREQDAVARIGGDEFVLILGNLGHKDDAEPMARRVIAEIAKPIPVSHGNACIGVSIGIAIYPTDSDDVETLMKWADKAMYAVKKRGKNNYCFFEACAKLPSEKSLADTEV